MKINTKNIALVISLLISLGCLILTYGFSINLTKSYSILNVRGWDSITLIVAGICFSLSQKENKIWKWFWLFYNTLAVLAIINLFSFSFDIKLGGDDQYILYIKLIPLGLLITHINNNFMRFLPKDGEAEFIK